MELGKTLNGLTLTGLPETLRRKMDRQLARINPILEQHMIETFEDYAQLTGGELEGIRQTILKVCDLAPAKLPIKVKLLHTVKPRTLTL